MDDSEIQWGHWFACVALALAIAMIMLWHIRPGGPIRRQVLDPVGTWHHIRWNLEHPLPLQPPPAPAPRREPPVPHIYARLAR